MACVVERPNLPSQQITGCIVSPQLPQEIRRNLLSLQINLYFVTPCATVQSPVFAHADMLAHHAGGTRVFLEPSQTQIFDVLKTHGLNPFYINDSLSTEYPQDVLLNCCVIGKNILCNKKYISREVLAHYERADYNVLHVNQGYTKCASLILNETALITEDESIAAVCGGAGIDALLIQKGDVRLDGYPYGFIGGAGGLLGPGKLGLFGDERTHADKTRIQAFAKRHGVEIIRLADGPLMDYGGLIAIFESEY